MPRYEVQIEDTTEVVPGPLAGNEPTPEVRSVITTEQAPSESDAIEVAWRVWDAKYGLNRRPQADSTRVTVRLVSGAE